MKTLRELAYSGQKIITAHRGASAIAPENTLSAFQEAIKAGANMIEIDVHFLADDKIAVFHDLHKFNIDDYSKLTSQQLKSIDIGSWFNPKFFNERIPLLNEVFELVKNKVYLLIEVKEIKNNNEKNIKLLVEEILKYQMENYILIASFDYTFLKKIKEIYPFIATGIIKLPNDDKLPSEIRKITNSEAYICSVNEMNQKISNDAEINNIFVGVYSIDDVETLHQILKYKVDAIATNNPALIVKELKKLGIYNSTN